MKISNARPPMYSEILAAFPGAGAPGVIFCWGDTIHAPKPLGTIGPELIAHESIHCDRQGSDPAGWWRRYIDDERFRLLEEFPAHLAEFNTLCRVYRDRWVSARAMRRHFATLIARKLAHPLYGGMISVSQAREMLLQGAREGIAA